MHTTIPSIEASHRGLLGSKLRTGSLRTFWRKRDYFSKAFIIIVPLGFIFGLIMFLVVGAKIQDDWNHTQMGISAVLEENPRATADDEDVARVSYVYEGKEQERVSPVDPFAAVGDTVEIAVDTNNGEPLRKIPNMLDAYLGGLFTFTLFSIIALLIIVFGEPAIRRKWS